jgi:hypothetical protein
VNLAAQYCSLAWSSIFVPIFWPFMAGSDGLVDTIWLVTASPIFCRCADHSQLSDARCFIQWGWLLLCCITAAVYRYCCLSLCVFYIEKGLMLMTVVPIPVCYLSQVICQKYKDNMIVCCSLQLWVVSVCCREKNDFHSCMKWYIFSFRSLLRFVYKWCLLSGIQLHN